MSLSPTETDFTMTIPYGGDGGEITCGFSLKFGKSVPDSHEDIILKSVMGAVAKPIEDYTQEQITAISHSLFEQWGAE